MSRTMDRYEYISLKKSYKDVKHTPVLLALLLYLSHVNGFHHVLSKYCYKPENSEVIWNITFNDTRLINIVNPNTSVIMQTRTYAVKDEWRDLKNCRRHAQADTYSIECEIDSSNYRILFDMRILLRNKTKLNENVIYENSYLYQDGFNCFPAHGIQNLTAFDVTSHTANISWNFYSWDVRKHLITFTKVHVHKIGEPIFSRFHYLNRRDALTAQHQITGLKSCTEYKVLVINEYISPAWNPERRNSSIRIKTTCQREKLFTDLEIAIIIISAILTLILMSLLAYFFYRQKSPQNSEASADAFGSIIDVRDLIYDSKIKPREEHDFDIRPRDNAEIYTEILNDVD